MGHGLDALVIRDSLTLEREGLITARVGDAAPYVEENQRINMLNARITNLGIRFCETIKAYATPCSSSEQ